MEVNTIYNNILLIDDDPASIYVTKSILEKAGIGNKIFTAGNGLEGLNLLIKHCLENDCEGQDLIIVDLKMPVMDGFKFLEYYNNLEDKIKVRIKIIVLSSSVNPRDFKKTKDLGIVDYIVKPLTKREIHRLIN